MFGFGMPSLGVANMAAMQQLASASSLAAQPHTTASAAATPLPSGSASQPPPSSSSPASNVAAVENVCVKMRGLPFSATQSDILSFFSGFQVRHLRSFPLLFCAEVKSAVHGRFHPEPQA